MEIPPYNKRNPAKYGGGGGDGGGGDGGDNDNQDDNKKGNGNKLFQTFKDRQHDLFHLGPEKNVT